MDTETIGIILSRQRTTKALIRLGESAPADLRLSCSHMAKTGFLMTWLKYEFTKGFCENHLDRVKRIWYLLAMRAAKVQASLRIRAVSPELSLLAHTSSESRGTFGQKAKSLAPLNGWACAVKICHDGVLEDTNSLDAAHLNYLNLPIGYLPCNCYHVQYGYFVIAGIKSRVVLSDIRVCLKHSSNYCRP